MPLPTSINDLSTTAGLNYPAGSDSPSILDDVQRAHASFIAKLRDESATSSALSASSGSSLVGYLPAGTGAVATTVQAKLRESVSVKDFGAVGDGLIDNYAALQAACDAVYAAGGGTVYLPPGNYICNTPLRVQRNTNLIGAGRDSTFITKDSTTTKAVTIVASAGVVYPGTLPSNINAIIVLDGAGGRYVGRLSDFTAQGTLATPGNYETQKVDLGIVSIGSVSDFKLENVSVLTTNFGWYFPNIFASTITNNRVSNCLIGSGIELGTSLTYTSNYMNSCRDVGHYLRALKYSLVSANACDSLNRADFYPTRTRTCTAYWLRSLVGCNVVSNGDEGTLGRSYYFNNMDNCVVEGNTTIAVGSDYVGVDEIAWHYTDGVLRCCRIENNIAYSVNANGLLYGGAVAGQHHNIYFVSKTNFLNTQYQDNIVRTALTAITEAGWGNNTNKPADYIEEGTFTPVIEGTTSVAGGAFSIGQTYRITSVGTTDFVAIGAASNTVGVKFVATGAGSGTGTAATAGTGTYTAQYGSYTRVGNRVFFTLRLSWSAHTGTGNMVLDGLPYTSRNVSRNEAAVTIGWVQTVALTAGNIASGHIEPNTTQITLEQYATGGGSVAAVPMDTAAGYMISGSYYAAT